MSVLLSRVRSELRNSETLTVTVPSGGADSLTANCFELPSSTSAVRGVATIPATSLSRATRFTRASTPSYPPPRARKVSVSRSETVFSSSAAVTLTGWATFHADTPEGMNVRVLESNVSPATVGEAIVTVTWPGGAVASATLNVSSEPSSIDKAPGITVIPAPATSLSMVSIATCLLTPPLARRVSVSRSETVFSSSAAVTVTVWAIFHADVPEGVNVRGVPFRLCVRSGFVNDGMVTVTSAEGWADRDT